ncbi:outer membrane receptor protein [Galbibacter orientalis DSM 19592]|mgnify:CR=1 FL=1|uniref:Outer membrane receptor protein n=1 Tax=Galbibacter orientalis DSM 19592 TaxID=926559 RepID=I3C177_9FLAO|nr:TonB-dependent receptor [Galbibacter orientalis]EIJ37370.1 outer membrane receptor protein [Galbibacter orientalis DSM 19592]
MFENKGFLIVLFLMFGGFTFAQKATLRGNIKYDDNTIAEGIYLILKGNGVQKDAATNPRGNYVFKEIPYGDYVLEVHSIDAKTQIIEVALYTEEVVKNSTLESSDHHELNEVMLHGKSQKTEIETEGFAVNVVDTKEAGLRNIQTNELLNTTVGVKIRQNGGLGSEVQYSLNGLSGSAVRIFIDGIPISVYGSSFSLNSIPPSMIKRIEVYKGVVPGYLADDALGGAINVVLHKGAKSNLNASVSYGSFNTLQASVNGLYRFKKSGFTVKGSLFHNYSDNDYEVSGRSVVVTGIGGVQTPVTAKRFNDAYRSTGGVVEVGFTDVKWADQFLVGFTGSDDYKEIQHGAFMTITPYKGRFMESDAKLANLTYQKENLFTEGLDVNIHGLYGKRNRMVNDTVAWAYNWLGERAIDFKGDEYKYSWGSQQEGGPTLSKIDRNVASIRTGISYEINNNHKILFNHVYSGIDREDSDELKSVLENTFVGTRDLQKNILSFTYELNAFNERLRTSLFGKYYQQKTIYIDPAIETDSNGNQVIVDDEISSNNTDNGYGFALSYAIKPTVTLLVSAEKAVRLPNETEVFGNDGDNVVANPSIQPERSNNLNFGFKFGTFRIKKHDFTIATNFFTRNIKDRIGLPIENSLNVNDETILYVNQGSGTSKGIDAQINYTYNNNLTFNFNASRFNLKVENRGLEIDVPNTPFFTMNGGGRYTIKNLLQNNSQLNLFYNVYFTEDFSYLPPQGENTVGDEFFRVPEQLVQDFGLSYTFPNNNFVMSFDIKNIFDKPVYDNLSVQKPGRAFYLKLNYFINNF